MHEHLSLVIGFETVPDDTASAELPLQVLTLIGGIGFALDPEDGWQPQQPTLKNGGVWAESSTSLGRTLIAGEDGNVTETMRLVLGTGDPKTLYKYVTTLNRFIETARQHWTTYYQTLPVYLKWKATCGAGYQYALIYNIDAVIDYSRQANGLADVTLSLEREPYWRAIAPGANPKRYYYEANRLVWKKANAGLDSGTDHFKVDTVENRFEWNTGFLTELSNNYLEVSNIPGDAPALLCLTLRPSGNANYVVQKVFVGRSTKNTPLTDRDVSTDRGLRRFIMLNAADGGGALADSGAVADTGAPIRATGGNFRRSIDFTTTAAMAQRWKWDNNQGVNFTELRGKFAVLVRMRQSGGTFGQIIARVQFRNGSDDTTSIVSLDGNPTIVAGTGNSAGWPLTYLGDITIPFGGPAVVSIGGYGEAVQTETEGTVTFWAQRTAGVGVLLVSDVILLPIDEGLFSIEASKMNSSGSTTYPTIIDTTGYMSRGTQDTVGYSTAGVAGINDLGQIKGDVFGLQPGVSNRLYFLTSGTHTAVADRSDPNQDMSVLVNIVPRWRGVRDV